MTKQEMTSKGLELVAYAGDARGCYLMALKKIQNKEFDQAEQLIQEAEQLIVQAHIAQTDLLAVEAGGNYSDVTLIMVHGQDHLMTTILLKDMIGTILDLAKKVK